MTAEVRHLRQFGIGKVSISLTLALTIAWNVLLPVLSGLASYHKAAASVNQRIDETRLLAEQRFATKDDVSASVAAIQIQMRDIQSSQNAVAHELGRLSGLIESLPRRR